MILREHRRQQVSEIQHTNLSQSTCRTRRIHRHGGCVSEKVSLHITKVRNKREQRGDSKESFGMH